MQAATLPQPQTGPSASQPKHLEAYGLRAAPLPIPELPAACLGPRDERSGWAGTGFPAPCLLLCQGCSSPWSQTPLCTRKELFVATASASQGRLAPRSL